jgi:iron(III) transport system substrate-binding protein
MLLCIGQNPLVATRSLSMNREPVAGLLTTAGGGLGSLLVLVSLISCGNDDAGSVPDSAAIPPLILYSSLPEETVRSITAAYTEHSGVAMHYMLEPAPVLVDKLRTKAHRPGADVLLIADAGQLAAAVEQDVLRPTHAEAIRQNVPATQRDPDGYWFGLSARAVAIVYDQRKVDPAHVGSYASLSGESWFGRLCLLSSKQEASRTVVAYLIATLGDRDAELVVRNWKKNGVGFVFPTERELLLAIEDGHCQIGFVGSGAIAELQEEGGADHVAPHWPAKADGGVLLSISGAGVSRHAANPEQAVQFLEWLSAAEGQRVLIASGWDLPVNPQATGMAVSSVESAQLGYLAPDAMKLAKRARYP